MTHPHDQTYLLSQQYHNAEKLDARIALHQRFSTTSESWFRWLFDTMALPQPARILELGTGSGMLWRENLDRLREGWRITLSDLSPGMLDGLPDALGGAAASFDYRIIDAQAIPYPDATFDVVIANHMLYHVPDRPRVLVEIRRVLAPDGTLYAATNGDRHLKEIYDLVARAFAVAPDDGTVAAFGLETGEAQLCEFFSHVDVYRRSNSLVVTEPAPLIAYVLSMRIAAHATQEQNERLTAWVEGEIAATGAPRITVDSGLLVAH